MTVHRPAMHGAMTTAKPAAGGVLVLDAVHDCAFGLRPSRATSLTRPHHHRHDRTEH